MQDSLLHYFGESVITFDQFVINMPSGHVLKNNKTIKLEPQVFTFLLLLIRNNDHIVTREEIVAEVWAGKKASDDALRALVKKLRIALGDNARAPKFLKTVPLQGYLFIMPVQIEFNPSEWWRSRYILYGFASLIIILLTLFVQSRFGTFQANPEIPQRKAIVSQITQMTGSEVSPYFLQNGSLLFSHRSVNDTSLHLYVKNPDFSSSTRLTWDNSDYYDGIFSPDGSQAVVKKEDGDLEVLLLFNFDNRFNLLSVEPITLDTLLDYERIEAVSYSRDGGQLYLLGYSPNLEGGGPLIDGMDSTDVGLINYDIDKRNTEFVKLDIPRQSEILEAKESADGKLLAVLFQNGFTTNLHVKDIDLNETLITERLPSGANSFVWAPDKASLSFTTREGDLLKLDIGKERIYSWSGLPIHASEVVNQCGEYCFVLKAQEPSIANILERPFLFAEKPYLSGRQFMFDANDRFPSYFDKGQGIYYLSLSDESLSIKSFRDTQGTRTIAKLPKTSDIKSFVLNPGETKFAGELDGRIFIYDLESGALSFLSVDIQAPAYPIWLEEDVLLYRMIQDNKSIIYSHDVVANTSKLIASGLVFVKPLSQNQWLLVDKQLGLYLYEIEQSEQANDTLDIVFSIEFLEQATKIADLATMSSDGFKVVDNTLFFMSQVENVFYFNKVDLKTKVSENKKVPLISALPSFDIHPNMQKMLLVESRLSQSRLLKVEGLTLSNRRINQVITETP